MRFGLIADSKRSPKFVCSDSNLSVFPLKAALRYAANGRGDSLSVRAITKHTKNDLCRTYAK